MHQHCYTQVSTAKSMYIWKPSYLSIFKNQLQKLSKNMIQNAQIIVQDSQFSYRLEYIKCESLLILNTLKPCSQQDMEYFKTFQNLFLITSKIWYMKLCITELALDFMNNTNTLLFKPFYKWAARPLQVFNSFFIKIKIKCIMYIRKRKKQENSSIIHTLEERIE